MVSRGIDTAWHAGRGGVTSVLHLKRNAGGGPFRALQTFVSLLARDLLCGWFLGSRVYLVCSECIGFRAEMDDSALAKNENAMNIEVFVCSQHALFRRFCRSKRCF